MCLRTSKLIDLSYYCFINELGVLHMQRLKFLIKSVGMLLMVLLLTNEVMATHIRAGEIIARRVSNSSLTYEFIIIGYTDTRSSVRFGGGEINFGDGTVIEILENDTFFQETIDLGENIAVNTFIIQHTFQAPGTFTVRFREFNRNANVVNMDASVDTPFYVETQIIIDPFFGLNNTPVLLTPPVDKGAVGARFLHNPGAFDPDGDSLSFHLVIPRQNVNLSVSNYRYPNAPEFYVDFQNAREEEPGTPTFKIDSITGDLEWDAPGMIGEYNLAFMVREWRKIAGEWNELGYVVRDMQVIIEETDNERPEILPPPDICVEAGTSIIEFIQATDPDGHRVKLEAYGGPFELNSSPASYSPNPPIFQNVPAIMRFDWETNCTHVRRRPYDVQLKATDDPPVGPKLVDFATWNITVVGPAPTGLTAAADSGRQVSLTWDNYSCPNASTIQVWRRVDSFAFTPDNCNIGIPANGGYQLVGEVDRRDTAFVDNDQGRGLAPGANYCYRLVAEYPLPAGGTSYASIEVCELVEATAPVLTNVTIDETSTTEGELTVRWMPPFDLDQAIYPPPYSYQVVQYIGSTGTGAGTEFAVQTDTFFVATGLNTRDRSYSYLVRLFDNTGFLVDSSAVGSSVRLDLNAGTDNLQLAWSAHVPWTNIAQAFPTHFIYRNNVDSFDPNEFVLIDQVNVAQSGFRYRDDGSHNGVPLSDEEEYCYYVTTRGTYGNPQIPSPLLNDSQIICGQPNDMIPPCPPIALRIDEDFDCVGYLESISCNFRDFENRILWDLDESDDCKEDTRSFNIYFSETGEEGSFEIIANVLENNFTHSGLSSFKGCYKISTIDRSGNESVLSEAVCNDNCPHYRLPNVFTPNGDGKNDFFTPYYSDGSIQGFDLSLCPRFVKSVVFKIYDRTGGELYTYDSTTDFENGILINWNGETTSGRLLENGTYFYTADVVYDVLDPSIAKEEIKGWVKLIK